jgi:hypothetical protein
VTVVVVVDTAALASRVTCEALPATWETVLVVTAAALSSAWAGPVVAAVALSTAPVVDVAILVAGAGAGAGAGAVGAGGEAAGATGAVEVCAGEDSSCAAVVTTLPTAPGAGMAAPDSSATASVTGKEHSMAAVINRALRRPESRGEGLRALPSISLGCEGFPPTDALYTRRPTKSSQIAAL